MILLENEKKVSKLRRLLSRWFDNIHRILLRRVLW